MKRTQFLRKAPGCRPLAPVRSDTCPDDWKCTWVYVQAVWSGAGPREGFWELKYINAACLEHARLAVAS